MSGTTDPLSIRQQRHRLLAALPDPAGRREIRLSAGYTLADFGEALGVTPSTVLGWEQGRTPSRFVLRDYLRLLDQLQSTARGEGR